jgi:hypothetical protein
MSSAGSDPVRLSASLALALLLCGCGGDAHRDRPSQAAPDALNAYVLEVLRTYPTDGTHRYHWPKDEPGAPQPWRGNARTLTYMGQVLGQGDPEGRCHCSGLTFEVFLQAWMARARAQGQPARIRDLDLAGVKRLHQQWFGSPEDKTTLRTALVENGLGVQLTDLEAARPGDFVQLWRHNGSGHAAVFLAWTRDAAGAITGLTYWSTQSATNGIGERTERFGDGPKDVRRDAFYLCRVGE